jgi:predicted O-methyltransferase YrrM
MKKLIANLLPIVDVLILPFMYPAALLMKAVRYGGIARMPLTKKVLLQVGVFPIRRHYYEPQFDFRDLPKPLSVERSLAGINWNVDGQLALLRNLDYREELKHIGNRSPGGPGFHFNNGAFESGDAEFWYSLIRNQRPRRIIEIGSGYSTLIAIEAIKKNREQDRHYHCDHVCIEPYEHSWLENSPVKVVRKKVEELPVAYFSELGEGDILFIDSSHILRPQGDVVFELLELLPSLAQGVIVHIHDIFSPRDYLEAWLHEDVRMWNEQYLLEAFLTHNSQWQIVASLNFLHHHYFDQLAEVCPYLEPSREPGSFYIRRISTS